MEVASAESTEEASAEESSSEEGEAATVSGRGAISGRVEPGRGRSRPSASAQPIQDPLDDDQDRADHRHTRRHTEPKGSRPLEQSAPRVAAWIAYEQTVNERIVNERLHAPIDGPSNTVKKAFRPEERAVWDLDRLLLPASEVREYGFAHAELYATFGLSVPKNRGVIFVHPQSRRLYRERVAKYGLEPSGLWVTPTASYRSLLAWKKGASPAILKVSLGAKIGGRKRRLHEKSIARGLLVSSLLDAIPKRARTLLRFEWFPERAGVVDARKRHGWLLRGLPPCLTRKGHTSLVPAFSLISRRGSREPLLVELIRRAGARPEQWLFEKLLVPYVNLLAYLLLEEGLEYEGHMQNVLFEVDSSGELTGTIVLRDVCDTTVNLALRLAKSKPLPLPPDGSLPRGARFAFASNAANFSIYLDRPRILRAGDTVERYGLQSFVWAINHSLRRFFPNYPARAVELTYLQLWQEAGVSYLSVKPLFRKTRAGLASGIAMDEAIAAYLERVDWSRGGHSRKKMLPSAAEPVLLWGRARRRRASSYVCFESAWGDLYVEDSLPVFFRPAF